MSQPNSDEAVIPSEVKDLTEAVRSLAGTVVTVRTSYRRLRGVVISLVALAVVALASVAWLIVLAVNQQHLIDRIGSVQDRTSNEVLCPLYKTLLSFEARSTAAPNLSPTEKQERADAYAVIHNGNTVLGCAP